ncbi:MAG TPA: gamma-glutamyl-gamma-aminobutyrate hydrolase family protein [Candidatus Limnocylindrales bacterium]|nr:gamma-glutamyl-gamma-aminobutyrate hydrolase family protein [Candidatus Limnocylindrales bacterium]
MVRAEPPLVVITIEDPDGFAEPAIDEDRYELYAEAVRTAGGEPRFVHPGMPTTERDAALDAMDGLLLAGGADVEPARYGCEIDGSRTIDRARDALEAVAWDVAAARAVPVLGICRGIQAINVFSGGTLLQHVDDHAGVSFGHGDPRRHELRLVAGTRLGELLGTTSELAVNTYHHQGIRDSDLAPDLVAAGWADSPAGPLVEALEAPAGRWLVGVQCHPERTASTPRSFGRLFEAFVEACVRPPVERVT